MRNVLVLPIRLWAPRAEAQLLVSPNTLHAFSTFTLTWILAQVTKDWHVYFEGSFFSHYSQDCGNTSPLLRTHSQAILDLNECHWKYGEHHPQHRQLPCLWLPTLLQSWKDFSVRRVDFPKRPCSSACWHHRWGLGQGTVCFFITHHFSQMFLCFDARSWWCYNIFLYFIYTFIQHPHCLPSKNMVSLI